ncbi:MAG: hypothetical protein P4L33_02745 [Capsulimonadaceae bacterium]|nr:hypothetical protein [Capsulimonadaceae bacterium]
MSDSSRISNSAMDNADVLPEEEPLFLEFQAYVRSVSKEVTKSAVSDLQAAVAQLAQVITQNREEFQRLSKTSIDELEDAVHTLSVTVQQSRSDYAALFAPATERFGRELDTRLAELERRFSIRTGEAVQTMHQQMTANAESLNASARSRFAQLATLSENASKRNAENLEQAVAALHDVAANSIETPMSALKTALGSVTHRLALIIGFLAVSQVITWALLAACLWHHR